jgi:phosphoribosylformylglycinamidine cyclo-ligase
VGAVPTQDGRSRDAGKSSYAGAGVDIEAGERAVALMRQAVSKTVGPAVIGGIGGFAGLFDASRLAMMRRPVLATSTDGVGTKVLIAQRTGSYGTIGIDLVGMVVDDLVVCGAEPLFMTDYIVCGRVTPERVAEIVGGIAEGCVQAGCALIGGETAEHPGHLGAEEFDLAGAATGVVEADRLLGPALVQPGDVVLGLASSGLHSNGFSLVRQILADADVGLDAEPQELGKPLGAELATPTRIYAQDCLALASGCQVRAFAHITGGGLAANMARVLPPDADARLDRATWSPPPVFALLARLGSVDADEMEHVFNMGVGMTAVVAAADADDAIELLAERGVPAWPLGKIVSGTGHAELTGRHP